MIMNRIVKILSAKFSSEEATVLAKNAGLPKKSILKLCKNVA